MYINILQLSVCIMCIIYRSTEPVKSLVFTLHGSACFERAQLCISKLLANCYVDTLQ